MAARGIRRLLFLVHQYTGFIFALYLIVVCTSGATLLLLETQIDGYRDYLMERVPVRGAALSIGTVIGVARDANPGRTMRHILLSCPSGCTYDASFDDGTNRLDVLIDPYTGKIVRTVVWEHTAIGVLYRLHGSLFAGDAGETINAAAGLSLVLLGCTGVLLWRRPRGRSSAKNVHKIAGVVSAAFLLMWALTAAGQVFWPDYDEPITPVAASNGAKAASLDQRIAAGTSALPGELTMVYPSRSVVVVRKRVAGDPDPYGYSYVAVDGYGRVLQVYDARTFPLLWRVREAMYAVHIGAPGGAVLRAIYAMMGLAPAVLFVTAFLMWRRALRPVRG